ncbi:hypothetical protein GGF43_001134 [Coemansia sp. RSA 2618]|nr:hypothetical protein GGF43_001134 [Coemansia sp. RSA 2618]
MDGYGFNMFVHRWAEISQMLATDSASADFGTCNAIFTRSAIQQAVHMPQEPLLSALYKMFIPGGYLSRYVAWVSPGIRGKILESIHASSDVALGCFHISSAAIEQLRQSVKATLATELRISDNDILMASTVVAYAQGVIKHKAKHMEFDLLCWLKGTLLGLGSKKPRTFVALEAVDIRPRMPNAQIANYTGNSAVAMMTLNPIDLLQMPASLELLAQIALSVRKSLTGVTSEYISQTVYGDAEADDAFRPHIYKAHFSERLMATNFTRFNLYTTNFGWGIPQSVVPLNLKFPKFVSFFPAHPSEGGYYINIVAPEGVLREMQTNEFWSASFKREY